MGKWADLSTWRGPTVNQGPQLTVQRGLVVHIAEGTFEGTIAWQKNPDANVSSHFVVGRLGQCAQMVDTSYQAWTQKAGNREWLSVECEGFTPADAHYRAGWEVLTGAQIETIARLLRKCNTVYDVPLQMAAGPTTKGLAWHSMGYEYGVDWGHRDCPGPDIKAQLPAIVARARQLAGYPALPGTGADEMSVDDARTAIAEMFDEAANGSTPTGRNFRNDLSTVLKPIVEAAVQPLVAAGGQAVDVEQQAETAVKRVLGALDGATPPAGA